MIAGAYVFNLPGQAQDKMRMWEGKCDYRGIDVYAVVSGRVD